MQFLKNLNRIVFSCGFLQKWLAHFYCTGKQIEIIHAEFNIVKPRQKCNILDIIDQINVSTVPLWIGHCHLCMESPYKDLKLFTHPLYLFVKECIVNCLPTPCISSWRSVLLTTSSGYPILWIIASSLALNNQIQINLLKKTSLYWASLSYWIISKL